FSNGFVGIDTVFVLSGYLVTYWLVHELQSSGSIGRISFYARRMRRVLPAAFGCLAATGVIWVAIASPAEVSAPAGGFRASFLYYANWYFARRLSGHPSATVSRSPVLHFWALAVTEQFYLVWPFLLGGLFVATRSARRQWQTIRTVVGVAMVASLVW